jgi:hypothetical protein
MAEEKKTEKAVAVSISPPNIQVAEFRIVGTAPLVIHRMSAKLKQQMLQKQMGGSVQASKKPKREAQDIEATFNEARYISAEGWDGFQACAIRNAMISACRLVNFKMTLAKMSIFTMGDGRDATEPQIDLVRIDGKLSKAETSTMLARVETGQPYVTIRPMYWPWKARLRIRFDADQFSTTDISNLLARVGAQVGIGEGRPDSKNSAGMGWGLFEIAGS